MIGILTIVVLLFTPWHILLFSFNIYVLVYGLRNVGLNDLLVNNLQDFIMVNPKLNGEPIGFIYRREPKFNGEVAKY
jgi:hypothetical protein